MWELEISITETPVHKSSVSIFPGVILAVLGGQLKQCDSNPQMHPFQPKLFKLSSIWNDCWVFLLRSLSAVAMDDDEQVIGC